MNAMKPTPKPTQPRHASACPAKCSGGNPCCANAKYRHQVHCCKEPSCVCREVLRGKVSR